MPVFGILAIIMRREREMIGKRGKVFTPCFQRFAGKIDWERLAESTMKGGEPFLATAAFTGTYSFRALLEFL
jgi:hypothetical protein